MLDAFPDNPADPPANGTHNLQHSMDTAMSSGATHNMWVQRYDITDPAQPDSYLAKVWSPTNTPIYDHHQLLGVVHRVEEITDLDATLSVMAQAVDAGDAMSVTDQLHTLTAFTTALPADRQTQQALAAENEQLRRALATRDVIGQAKGILTERYNIDATAAFDLLIKLSQDSNTPVTEVARTLIELDDTPNIRHT